MITNYFTGETIKIEASVFDSSDDPIDLQGSIAKFAMKRIYPRGLTDDEVIVKDVVIGGASNNVLSITLDSSETLIAGRYKYEFRILLNAEEKSVDQGTIVLEESIIKGLNA